MLFFSESGKHAVSHFEGSNFTWFHCPDGISFIGCGDVLTARDKIWGRNEISVKKKKKKEISGIL